MLNDSEITERKSAVKGGVWEGLKSRGTDRYGELLHGERVKSDWTLENKLLRWWSFKLV